MIAINEILHLLPVSVFVLSQHLILSSAVNLCQSATPCPKDGLSYFYCLEGIATNGCRYSSSGEFPSAACISQCATKISTYLPPRPSPIRRTPAPLTRRPPPPNKSSRKPPPSPKIHPPKPYPPSPSSPGPWSLLWSDEFDPQQAINQSNWEFMLGDGSSYGPGAGWGNQEQECYTSSPSNAAIIADPSNSANGLLSITALSQPGYGCINPGGKPTSTRGWTSARLWSKGKRSFMWPGSSSSSNSTPATAVMIEARIRIPIAMDTWPAFWMMPEGSVYGGWPASGEIDIMEHINANGLFYGTLHFGKEGAHASTGGSKDIGSGSSDWHTFGVRWSSQSISFLIDGNVYFTVDKGSWWSGGAPGSASAPFDAPFYIIMNLAIGGNWPGNNIAPGPHVMLVDWVRVWNSK